MNQGELVGKIQINKYLEYTWLKHLNYGMHGIQIQNNIQIITCFTIFFWPQPLHNKPKRRSKVTLSLFSELNIILTFRNCVWILLEELKYQKTVVICHLTGQKQNVKTHSPYFSQFSFGLLILPSVHRLLLGDSQKHLERGNLA